MLLPLFSFSNPIFVAFSLIKEVYFEGDEWFLVIDNEVMNFLELEDFMFVQFSCNEGSLFIDYDVVPNYSEEWTIITVDDLIAPVQIQRSGDCLVTTILFPSYELPALEWNDILPSPVCAPGEGQSLYTMVMWASWDESEIWLTKNDNPVMFNSGVPEYQGNFTGKVYDLVGNPVAEAQIHYLDESYIQCGMNDFDYLWTDGTGYFETGEIPARNYYIEKITKASQTFFVNEYVSIEPGLNYFEYTTDFLERTPMTKDNAGWEIRNYPNPFSSYTNFEIRVPDDFLSGAGQIQIYDASGRIISIIQLSFYLSKNGVLTVPWTKPGNLPMGHYMYRLTAGGSSIANGIITLF